MVISIWRIVRKLEFDKGVSIMDILMVKAYGEFDCTYTAPVLGSSDNGNFLSKIAKHMNDYCANHPKVNMDVELLDDFNNNRDNLLFAVNAVVRNIDISNSILTMLKRICSSNKVLISDDIFSVEYVLEI